MKKIDTQIQGHHDTRRQATPKVLNFSLKPNSSSYNSERYKLRVLAVIAIHITIIDQGSNYGRIEYLLTRIYFHLRPLAIPQYIHAVVWEILCTLTFHSH